MAAVVLVHSVSQLINFVTQLFIAESINNYDCFIFYFIYKKSGFQCLSSSVGDSQQAMNKRVKNSVTRKQNAVMCLLVGVLSAAFTHVIDACQTVDENKNDSK